MTSIEEIWNIRRLVDDAIISKDKELIKLAMQRLEVIYPDLINLSETTRSFHRAYRTEDEKLEDKRENADKLLNNMNSIYDKYVNGKRNVSIKFGEQPRSIATAIWVARAMLDDVRNKAKKPEFIEIISFKLYGRYQKSLSLTSLIEIKVCINYQIEFL